MAYQVSHTYYTEKAERALEWATNFARARGSRYICADDILYAIISSAWNSVEPIFRSSGSSFEDARDALRENFSARTVIRQAELSTQNIDYSQATRNVLLCAIDVACRDESAYVDTRHIFLAMLVEPDHAAQPILCRLGVK